MTRYRGLLFILGVYVVTALSCKRYYEEVPVERITEEYVWDQLDSNGKSARAYLTQIYALTPPGFNRLGSDLLCSASDDAMPSRPSTDVRTMATGGMTIFFGESQDNTWAKDYIGIRKATIFLNNFGVVPLKDVNEKRYWFGEARVLRAMFYWELVRRWGGVPLLSDTVSTLDDNVEFPRNNFAECIDYIVTECDRAKDSLRPDPVDPGNIGRWTKGAAMALKARVLLYAASQLYNGGNTGTELNGYSSGDITRWKKAADAAKAVMDLGAYQLDPVFNNIFITDRSVETIMVRTNGTGTGIETDNGPPNYAAAFGKALTSPTEELVEAFGMKNGREITDPASGYKPDSPYNNKDPRFYSTVLFNGGSWLSTPLATYEGGFAKPGGSATQTQTSYYMRKFMGNFENSTTYSSHYNDFIFFRYAEVLLNFAEAQNEYSGPDPDVYAAVEAVRQRAGLVPYQLDSMGVVINQESLRDIIRKERRKEMAFEEQRYWDIRRWKIADTIYNKPLHGMNIFRSPSGNLTYVVVPVLNTVFDKNKMYFYPIPYNEIVSNKNMVQNPGW